MIFPELLKGRPFQGHHLLRCQIQPLPHFLGAQGRAPFQTEAQAQKLCLLRFQGGEHFRNPLAALEICGVFHRLFIIRLLPGLFPVLDFLPQLGI